MLRTSIALFTVTVMFATSASLGAENQLHPCEAETAKLMSMNSTWPEIYKAANAMPPACFDGYFAEGISDTIVRKMGQDWPGFLSVLVLHAKDSKFTKLILESINATLDPNDIKVIERLAQNSCRAEVLNLCRAISKEAVDALAEYDSPKPSYEPNLTFKRDAPKRAP
jgi:hypothetical protein